MKSIVLRYENGELKDVMDVVNIQSSDELERFLKELRDNKARELEISLENETKAKALKKEELEKRIYSTSSFFLVYNALRISILFGEIELKDGEEWVLNLGNSLITGKISINEAINSYEPLKTLFNSVFYKELEEWNKY